MILKTDPAHPAASALDQAAEILSGGGLVVVPTETRYGLLARGDEQSILERLYRVKRRELNRPTALLVRDADEIGRLGKTNRAAEALVNRFLPGPLTLVLRSVHDWPPPRVVDGRIGVRWSSAVVIRELLSRFDFPVTATSANISGQNNRVDVESIEQDIGDGVELYLDAGRLSAQFSTVVDCSGEPVRLLREGAISRIEIEQAVGRNE